SATATSPAPPCTPRSLTATTDRPRSRPTTSTASTTSTSRLYNDAVPRTDASLAEKRRILQLETLYDLAIALHSQRPEQELVDELLLRVCTVLDPAAAVAVTRDPYGGSRGVATVGWIEAPPSGVALLAAPIWRELLAEGHLLTRSRGELVGRP